MTGGGLGSLFFQDTASVVLGVGWERGGGGGGGALLKTGEHRGSHPASESSTQTTPHLAIGVQVNVPILDVKDAPARYFVRGIGPESGTTDAMTHRDTHTSLVINEKRECLHTHSHTHTHTHTHTGSTLGNLRRMPTHKGQPKLSPKREPKPLSPSAWDVPSGRRSCPR
jgi:hypothetical protein